MPSFERQYEPFDKQEQPKVSRRGFLMAGLGAAAFLAGRKYESLAPQPDNPDQNQEFEQQLDSLKEGLAGKTLELNTILQEEGTDTATKQQAQLALGLLGAFALNLAVVEAMNKKLLAARESGDVSAEEEIAEEMDPYLKEVNRIITSADREEIEITEDEPIMI